MVSSNKSSLVPGAREALDKFKMEAASVGGRMVIPYAPDSVLTLSAKTAML